MTVLRFSKLHGAGNDFVFLDAWNDEINLDPEQVQTLCDRHFGIGADGVIVVRRPSHPGNAGFMDYINADGTLAQMCGNGVRCFAKYVVDHGYASDNGEGIVVETRAGEKRIRVGFGSDGRVSQATVEMGQPHLAPSVIPTTLEANALDSYVGSYVREQPLSSPWGEFRFTCVSMGNPHAVCFIDDWSSVDDALFAPETDKALENLDVNRIGAYFESHSVFPEKANIEFACMDVSSIKMRVYERGCAETLACGTGACATLVAAYLTGRCSPSSDVHLLGGTLHIDYIVKTGTVFMTGPATESFTGEIDL